MTKSLTDPTQQTADETAFWERAEREVAEAGADGKITCGFCNGLGVTSIDHGYTLMDPACPVCKGAGRVKP